MDTFSSKNSIDVDISLLRKKLIFFFGGVLEYFTDTYDLFVAGVATCASYPVVAI